MARRDRLIASSSAPVLERLNPALAPQALALLFI
jgi:hypothetical protein